LPVWVGLVRCKAAKGVVITEDTMKTLSIADIQTLATLTSDIAYTPGGVCASTPFGDEGQVIFGQGSTLEEALRDLAVEIRFQNDEAEGFIFHG